MSIVKFDDPETSKYDGEKYNAFPVIEVSSSGRTTSSGSEHE